MEKEKEEWKRKWIIYGLNDKLFRIDDELNRKVLCESCKGKKTDKLTDKYGNEKIARFLYDSKLNRKKYYYEYVRWIPFNEFENIEYLAKGGFGEVYKAWIDYYCGGKREVVLKRIYNSGDKISDILKEVYKNFDLLLFKQNLHRDDNTKKFIIVVTIKY